MLFYSISNDRQKLHVGGEGIRQPSGFSLPNGARVSSMFAQATIFVAAEVGDEWSHRYEAKKILHQVDRERITSAGDCDKEFKPNPKDAYFLLKDGCWRGRRCIA